jgi:tRNA (guanine-N7-)-methyltransferase
MAKMNWYRAEELVWPVSWTELFGRSAVLLAEIGFGGGEFLLALAQQRPEANIIGFEISVPSLRRAVKKIRQAKVGNVRLVQGKADEAIWLLCAPRSLCGVTINFPDPWPKPAHHGRRLIDDQFLDLLATRMAAGASLEIATDDAAYAAVIGDRLAHSPYFQSQLATPYLTKDPQRVVTKYERLAREAGSTCYYFKWRRNEDDAPDRFILPQELPVPHMILKTALGVEEIGRRFAPTTIEKGVVRVKFMECYRSLRDGKLLVEALVTEGPLRQQVCLALRPRSVPEGDEHELMLGLHEIGFPRPTRGIHIALDHLGKWLCEIAPGTEIVRSNLVPDGPPEE